MLHTQKPSPMLEMPAPAPEEAGLTDAASFAIAVVTRHYLIILFAALLTTSIGATYLWITPPTYTATTDILIDRGKSPFFQQQGVFLPESPIDSAQMESQIQILSSRRIAALVVKNLHLAEDPAFLAGGLVDFLKGKLGDALRTLIFRFNKPAASASGSESALVYRAAAVLLGNLQVNRVGISFNIDINYRSHSPERAAQIANALAEAYIVDQMDAKYEAQRRTSDWLQNRANELGRQAATSDNAVNTYKAANNMVTVGGTLIKDQEVTELNKQLITAREKTSESLARLNRIESILGSDSAIDGTVSEAFSNPIITKLRQQYLEMVNREAEYSVRYGQNHAAVVNLRKQIRDTKTSILNELRRLEESFKSEYLISKQRQDSLEKDLARSVAQSQESDKAEAALRELESNAHSARSLYDLFLQRYMESLQQQAYVTAEARVVAPAEPPQQKSAPKTSFILALSVLGGVGSGLCLAVLLDMMDHVFRTAEQIEKVIQVPCVALVPLLKELPKGTGRASTRTPALDRSRTICREANILWTVVDSPLSSFAEAIRSIKLAVDFQGANGSSTVIGFTSAVPNEGKSTVAASLALLIGQVGSRVILIDCDLRNPTLTRTLTPKATMGIVEVLSGQRSVEEVSWRCPVTNLTVLPAIEKSGLLHTSEILSSAQTKKLFEQLHANYDYLVVDLPPLAPVIDVRATGHLVDFYFLVVEWGSTKIDVVQHALSRARPVHENLAGTILNKANMEQIGRYDMRRREYYDNRHYARYGYTT
jgi:polysaccharide biosynthesis transport protein